jgi:tetratricopeptide (TPR) repeat protein
VVELEDAIYLRLSELAAAGDAAAEAEEFDLAISRYRDALAFLPAPAAQWEAQRWLLAAIGDASYQKGDLELARNSFMEAARNSLEACGNPFVRLRLGQTLFDLGEFKAAEDWLSGAYMLAGASLFADEDPKYLTFARANLLPPPGGWSEGW